MNHRIQRVEPGSLAARLGLAAGDRLVSIDGQNVIDLIDFQALCCASKLRLVVERGGKRTEYAIEKDDYEPLGLSFATSLMSAMRTCKNCGKYFALTVHGSTEYCSHVFDSRGRTCKEVGAMRQYLQSHAQDELLKIYRREYKRRFAWIRAGKISQEAFSAWSKEAQREKEKCENGKISQGEFAQWLKR